LTFQRQKLLYDLWNNQIFIGPTGELASPEDWHIESVPPSGGCSPDTFLAAFTAAERDIPPRFL